MATSILLEACVDSVESAVAAQQGGAGRVELCADLLEGGCTPSAGTIQLARRQLDIRLHVIIRPRGGDFCYSDAEFEVMKLDVELCKRIGADGVVIGILNPDGTVDAGRTRSLVELARPLSVTFHRAFDMTRDPDEALEALIGIGVDRILTSGHEPSALEGLDMLAALVERAGGRIAIMAGGGINSHNVARIVAASGVTEVHAHAGGTVDSRMHHRNTRVFMGGALRPPEYVVSVTAPEQIRALVDPGIVTAPRHTAFPAQQTTPHLASVPAEYTYNCSILSVSAQFSLRYISAGNRTMCLPGSKSPTSAGRAAPGPGCFLPNFS